MTQINTAGVYFPNPVRYVADVTRCKTFQDTDPFTGNTRSQFTKLSDTAVFPGENVQEFENIPRKGFQFSACNTGVVCTHPDLKGFALVVPLSQWFQLFAAVGGFSKDTEFVIAERGDLVTQFLVPAQLVQQPEFASFFIAAPDYVDFENLEQGASYMQRYGNLEQWYIRTDKTQYLLGASIVSVPRKGQAFHRQAKPALSNVEVDAFKVLLQFFNENAFGLDGSFDEDALRTAFYNIQGTPVSTAFQGKWVFNRNYTQDVNCWEKLLNMPIWQHLTAEGPAPLIGTPRLELIVKVSPGNMTIRGGIKGANNRANPYRSLGSDIIFDLNITAGSISMLMEFLQNFVAVLEPQY